MVFVAGAVRGLGWGGVNIGGYTVLATVAPPQRRAEAAAYYTSAIATGFVLFPALALWLIDSHGAFEWVFLLCAALSLLGLPAALKLPGDNSEQPVSPPSGSRRLLDRRVLVATYLNLASTLAMPSAMAFMPLYGRSLGIENIGYFYVLSGVINIVIRPLLGQKADALGRGPAIAIGLIAQLAGFAVIAAGHTLGAILVGGTLISIGSSLIGSSSTALAMDLAHPQSRGQSMATYSLSYQLGAGIGAIIAGTLADAFGYSAMYVGAAVITASGLLLLAFRWKSLTKSSNTESQVGPR
jgi:MFS family permease